MAAGDLLHQEYLLYSTPRIRNPLEFSRDLFQAVNLPNPPDHVLHSIKGSESPLDMIYRMLPSDHHGD